MSDAPGLPATTEAPIDRGACQVIVLAAGTGSRLGAAAEGRPKCLVDLAGTTPLDQQLLLYRRRGLDATILAGGLARQLEGHGAPVRVDPHHGTGNMVSSLRSARSWIRPEQSTLVVYGDIVFREHVLAAALDAPGRVSVVVDHDWRELWTFRMDDPSIDCESLRLEGETIVDIGRSPVDPDVVEAQFIGMTKFAPGVLAETLDWFDTRVAAQPAYWRVSMTELLMDRVHQGEVLTAVPVRSGWLEVDTVQDLVRYRNAHRSGGLERFWSPEVARRNSQELTRWTPGSDAFWTSENPL